VGVYPVLCDDVNSSGRHIDGWCAAQLGLH